MADELERRAYDYLRRIDQFGGMVEAVIDAQRRIVVGVNPYQQVNEEPIQIPWIDPALEPKQIGPLAAVRARRDADAVETSLALRPAAVTDANLNLMPPLIACARAHAAEGEIVAAVQQVLGGYTEVPVF
jgi:methylmalonyl-CoA mutase, N-terminal domain